MEPIVPPAKSAPRWRVIATLALSTAAADLQAQPATTAGPPLEEIARTPAELGLTEPPVAQPRAPAPAPLSPEPVSPDLFGTIALPAPAAGAAARWAAVRDAVVTSPLLDQLAATAFAVAPERRLAAVQSTVNHQIAYRPDRQWWGLEDYWASADQTVMRRGGDCEDIAIVKLHLLRRLGFAADQLYLVIGRLDDSKRGAGDHAVALVRTGGGGWMVLDDRFDAPIAADRFGGLQPVLTFAAQSSWIHGRHTAGSADLRPPAGTAF